MPLLVECTSCGKKYNADESMAGRRIKCRQCGTIFVVPSLSGDDELNASMNALAEMENSQAGESMVHESVAGSYSQNEASDEQQADERDVGEDRQVPEHRPGRGFTYPNSAIVDRWLPIILAVGGPAWVMYASFKNDPSGTPWLAALRGAVLLIAYLLILFPLALKGMHMAGRDTGFGLPRDARWTAMVSFMPAFVFGAVMWIVGGSILGLVLGTIVGFAFSVGAMLLLFHLDPGDLPAAAGYAGGMFAFGLGIAGGVLFGLNILLSTVLVSVHKADRLPGSPFSVNFTWPPPPQMAPPPVARKTPTPSAPSASASAPAPSVASNNQNPATPAAPTTQEVATATPNSNTNPPDSSAAPTTQSTDPFLPVSTPEKHASIFDQNTEQANTNAVNPPATPKITQPNPAPSAVPQTNSPLVASVELAPIDSHFDEIVRPSAPSDWAALIRKSGDRGEIDRYWSGPLNSEAPATPGAAAPGGSAGATKAWSLAGTAPFVPEQQQRNRYALSADGDLLTHVTTFPSLSVAVYSYNKKAQIQILKLLESDGQAEVVGFAGNDRLLVHRSMAGNDGFELWNARDGKSPRAFRSESFEQTGMPLAISLDGTMLAIAARDQSHGGVGGGAGGGTPGGAALYIHDLGQFGVRRLAISDLDPKWQVSPTGLAFSPDNTKLAVLFEQGPNGLLVVFHSKTIVKPIAEQVFNPMPVQAHEFSGSSILWLSEDAMLLYGQTMIQVGDNNAAPIGEIGIQNITSQHFSKPDLCELGFTNPAGPQIALVKLKMDQITKSPR